MPAELETFDHTIEVDLTKADIAKKHARNSEIDRAIAGIKAERAKASKEFKTRIDLLLKEQQALLKCTDARKEKIEVKCYHQRDDARGLMLTMRVDTNVQVDERQLTAEERQLDLLDDGAGSEEEEAAG